MGSEFSSETKVDNIPAPWQGELAEGDFVSYMPSYESGHYLDLFTENIYPCDTVGDMVYYVYDPVANGASPDGVYPLLVWFHGATNALDGKICVSNCGGEMYASPEYQRKIGGAYIVVPLANERRGEDGRLEGSWSPEYLEPVKAIIDAVKDKHGKNISKTFVLGGSSGGYFSWLYTGRYPESVDVCVPIASSWVPEEEELRRIEENNITVLAAHGRHDELAPFDKCIEPYEERLLSMKNCICYFPEWVRNGDGGVASLNFGFEMGQHCLIIQFQADLMYDDGTCYDERFPEGVTGWIRSLL